jgi:hypothetical protein
VIPSFESEGNLPPGIHHATWSELASRFGGTVHRRNLLEGLKRALESLRQAGCNRVYVDGSFVTAKVEPDDFDGCWEVHGVDPDKLDPVLLTFTNKRAAQKAKYRGELFLADSQADPAGTRFIDFFNATKTETPRE